MSKDYGFKNIDYQDKIIADTLRQLSCGMTCFIYDKDQVKILEEMYAKKYGKVLRIEPKEDYIKLLPDGKAVKHLIF